MFSMLVLASHSPRRRELLENAGFQVVVRPSNVPEELGRDEEPEGYVRRLATAKARAVARAAGEVVLGADTVVVLGGRVLEKPCDEQDAASMLRMLSGRQHSVLTGICIIHDSGELEDVSRTEVTMHSMSEHEIASYIASGEHRDKAGAYGIQGRASKFVSRVDGCYFNVVGLPVSLVYRTLRQCPGLPNME
jgi:septum formation protein